MAAFGADFKVCTKPNGGHQNGKANMFEFFELTTDINSLRKMTSMPASLICLDIFKNHA